MLMDDKITVRGPQILAAIAAARAHRVEAMPDVDAVMRQMTICCQRLRDLGWQEIIYCPKDGTVFDAIEFGSTGIHPCHYEGTWPKGSWRVHVGGTTFPSRPVMFRLRAAAEEEK